MLGVRSTAGNKWDILIPPRFHHTFLLEKQTFLPRLAEIDLWVVKQTHSDQVSGHSVVNRQEVRITWFELSQLSYHFQSFWGMKNRKLIAQYMIRIRDLHTSKTAALTGWLQSRQTTAPTTLTELITSNNETCLSSVSLYISTYRFTLFNRTTTKVILFAVLLAIWIQGSIVYLCGPCIK